MRRSQLVHPRKILSPVILASGWREWGEGGRWAPLDAPQPTQIKYTGVSVDVCFPADSGPALCRPSAGPGVSGPRGSGPLRSSGGAWGGGKGDWRVEGWKKAARVGVRKKPQVGKQSTDEGSARKQSSGSLEDERPESLLSLQNEGKNSKNLLPLPLGRLTFF